MTANEQLVQGVNQWLEKQGYPLEMQAASAFRAHGLRVRQSQHYLDAESQKSREIDLVCEVEDDYGLSSMRLVVECKSGKKPWVVFSSPHTLAGYNRLFAFGILSRDLRRVLSDSVVTLPKTLRWFNKEGRIGYSVAQAFTEGCDTPFAALMSVMKASVWQHAQKAGAQPRYLATFPAIVIDAPLFECFLDDQGKQQLMQVAEMDLFFSTHIGSYQETCVRIVTLSGLAAYCSGAKAECTALSGLIERVVAAGRQALLRSAREVIDTDG